MEHVTKKYFIIFSSLHGICDLASYFWKSEQYKKQSKSWYTKLTWKLHFWPLNIIPNHILLLNYAHWHFHSSFFIDSIYKLSTKHCASSESLIRQLSLRVITYITLWTRRESVILNSSCSTKFDFPDFCLDLKVSSCSKR